MCFTKPVTCFKEKSHCYQLINWSTCRLCYSCVSLWPLARGPLCSFHISMFEHSGAHEEITDRVFQPLTRCLRSKGNCCREALSDPDSWTPSLPPLPSPLPSLFFRYSYLHFLYFWSCILHCFVIRGRNNHQVLEKSLGGQNNSKDIYNL